jgi:REP element-mobilizing transposase RayT
MKKNMNKNRKSIRLKYYDYSQAGMYFVAVCANKHKLLLGKIKNGKMILNDIGKIVNNCIINIPEHFKQSDIAAHVVMPNHIHMIIGISGRRGTACRAPTIERFGKPVKGSVPTIIRSFKSAATHKINKLKNTPGKKFWQRNYYEHIIRDENELESIKDTA